MKKRLFIIASALLLAACNDEDSVSGPTIEAVQPNEDVQSVVDMTEDNVYASLIYSAEGTSYLMLNAQGKTNVQTEAADDILKIHITEENTTDTVEDKVYAFTLDQEYETIQLFLNEKEIQFDVWYE